MKPPMQEELEDDLAAEEENKLINEVYLPGTHNSIGPQLTNLMP